MTGRFLVQGALVSGLLASCGGNVEHRFDDPGGSTGGSSSASGRGGASSVAGRGGSIAQGGGLAGRGGSAPGTGGAVIMDAGFDEYVDPGCPDAEAPLGVIECDPLAPVSGCALGFGCYPYVEHPFGSGCDQQTYGALCLVPGVGAQGDACSDDSPTFDHCAPGHVCVIGILPGKRCAKLCRLSGPDVCPSGMICGDLDVEGYGVCG